MKKTVQSRLLSTGLLFLAGLSAVHADTSVTHIAKVPFAFSVGDASLPAGEYTVDEFSSGIVAFRKDQTNAVFKLTYGGTTPKTDRNDGIPKLVFHRYDDEYFLFELDSGNGQPNRRIPVSKLENERITASQRVASGRTQAQDVVVDLALAAR